jgi:hypothetical protein
MSIVKLILAVVVFAIFYSTCSQSESVQRTGVPPQKSPEALALESVSLKSYDWEKGGFDSIMMLKNIVIENKGARDVKDLTIECVGSAKSGTRIDKNVRVLYEIVPAGKSTRVKELNMGFLHSQVDRAGCVITKLSLI